MINKFMVYDRVHNKVGIAEIDCDQLVMTDAERRQNMEDSVRRRPKVADQRDFDTRNRKYDSSIPDSVRYFDRSIAAKSIAESLVSMYTVYCGLVLGSMFIACMLIRKIKTMKRRSRTRYETLTHSDHDSNDSTRKELSRLLRKQ